MRRLAVLGLTLGLLLCWGATAGALEVTPYENKSDWIQAVGGQFETEDFNDDVLNPGLDYTASESGQISNGYYHDNLNSDSANAPQTIWTFDPYIRAFGGNWNLGGPGGGGNSLLIFVNDLSDPDNLDLYTQVGTISSDYVNFEFWGFISVTPFSSVLMMGGAGSNQQIYMLDDMVYSPVPVPGTLGLLSGGLLGLLAFRRLRL